MFYNENPEGRIHHIYNRGVDKRKIFMNEYDYSCFLSTLQVRNQVVSRGSMEQYVSILAYCLMPNHYHLLVEESIDDGISRFMARVGNSYTKTFNEKYQRTGRLFESRYKSVNVSRENQLLYLVDYIHYNPVRAGMVSEPHKYNWSSSREFINRMNGLCSSEFIKGIHQII